MDLHPVLPFLTYASPEALLVFNLALCSGALFLGPRRPGSSEETFAAWSGGALWGAALVFLQFKATRLSPSSWLETRFVFEGVMTALAAGWATRTALVGREHLGAALYLALALVAAVIVSHGATTTIESSGSVAVTCGAVVFGVGVFAGLLARAGSDSGARSVP